MVRRKIFTAIGNLPEAFALVIVLTTLALLFTYTATWMQSEYIVRWLPNAVVNGIDLKAIDWFRGIDSSAFDGAIRPRFISYGLTALTVKFRLWLYGFFVPFPNLSIAFIISIVATPFLYFFFSKALLGSRKAAFFATCLHLTSIGFISSTSYQYHQGKVLIQPVVVLLFLLLARLHSQPNAQYFGRERAGIVAGILALNFIGIAVDETYAVMACVGVVLFYRVFLPRQWNRNEIRESAIALFRYFVPFVLFAVFVFILPYLFKGSPEFFVSNPDQYYITYVNSEAGRRLAFDGSLFPDIWESLVETTRSYFYPSAITTNFGLGGLAWWAFAAVFLFVLPFIVFSRKGRRVSLSLNKDLVADRLLWGLPVAVVIYIVASTILQQFHSQFVSGFYYGSLASVLLPLLPAALFLRWKGAPSAVGKILIIVMMTITASNGFYFTIGGSGNHGNYLSNLVNRKHLDHKYPLDLWDTFPGMDVAFRAKPRSVWSPQKEQETRDLLYSHWRNWKNGKPIDFSKISSWDSETMWFLVEMYYLQGAQTLRGNFGAPAGEGTMLYVARAEARAAGIELPPQNQLEVDAMAALAKAQSQAPGGKYAGSVEEYIEDYRQKRTIAELKIRQEQNIAEFKKWRQSVPDYEKRLYDRVKKLNKRQIQLRGIFIGGIIVILLVLFGGFYAVLARLRKNHSDHQTSR